MTLSPVVYVVGPAERARVVAGEGEIVADELYSALNGAIHSPGDSALVVYYSPQGSRQAAMNLTFPARLTLIGQTTVFHEHQQVVTLALADRRARPAPFETPVVTYVFDRTRPDFAGVRFGFRQTPTETVVSCLETGATRPGQVGYIVQYDAAELAAGVVEVEDLAVGRRARNLARSIPRSRFEFLDFLRSPGRAQRVNAWAFRSAMTLGVLIFCGIGFNRT
ncbi:MAG: hypothetical protein HYT76_00810 [Deltaproteobacteria bacterium]|nr:hypothetical protein [Deltaproteobacteria bacterium]